MSAFAESAMAVNRVVLQHMSLNMLEEIESYHPVSNSLNIDEDCNIFPPIETNEDFGTIVFTTSTDVMPRGSKRYLTMILTIFAVESSTFLP